MTNDNPGRTLQVTFEYADANDNAPRTTIHNASILIPSLNDQVMRYGLHRTSYQSTMMVGQLKGGRESFVAMIQSYGFNVNVV
mgnify:CR=1 FL=1